ncbi:hypothetical protein [Nostoc commune]|uniref:hypothetical protein n=1 Tax=Nostoc commune TaxID=1178 RepID=UPI0018C4B902|nr:hypothetical protein [Nostoc commune]MBG1264709.1 hypothetical protein [Nostoc commune BAE]
MIVVDTGFFVALGNQNDQYHQLALQVLNALNEPLVTTYPIALAKSKKAIALSKSINLRSQFFA